MIRDFGSFSRRALLADLEHPAEIWWGHNHRQSKGGETGEEPLQASLAKSRSRTSAGDTGTIANASLSSLLCDVPICNGEIHKSSITGTKWISTKISFDLTS